MWEGTRQRTVAAHAGGESVAAAGDRRGSGGCRHRVGPGHGPDRRSHPHLQRTGRTAGQGKATGGDDLELRRSQRNGRETAGRAGQDVRREVYTMDALLAIVKFLVDEIFSKPFYLVGLMTAVGLIALRRPTSQVIGGTVKAPVGFLILVVGAGTAMNALDPLARLTLRAAVVEGGDGG